MGKEENCVVSILREYFKVKNIFWVRVPAGGYFRGMYLGDNVGAPDIIACIDGKLVGIETKKPSGGEHRDTQKLAQEHIERCGGKYLIIRSLAELQEAGI